MNNVLTSRRASLAIRVGGPLAAAAVLAAACSSSGTSGSPASPASSAPSVSAGGTSAPASSAPSASAGGTSATTVDVHASNGKSFLTDSAGRSLYLWVPDTSTNSMCSGACATAWPPLTTTGTPTGGSGVAASDLGTINRSDGAKQVTYAGHPLYYFAGDSAAGQTNGEGSNGFGAPWYLVAPSGQQITSLSAASAPSPAPSSNAGSKAGGGWS